MTYVIAEPRIGANDNACAGEYPAGCPAARAVCPASR
jgi:hypothetical protein